MCAKTVTVSCLARVRCDGGVYSPSSHQVGHALQCQVGYTAIVLVAAIPEGQLVKETSLS